MRIRASIATITKTTAVVAAIWAGAGCTHASGKLAVDVPKMLPYEAPDIDDITGIDSSEEPAPSNSAGAGSAQTPQK